MYKQDISTSEIAAFVGVSERNMQWFMKEFMEGSEAFMPHIAAKSERHSLLINMAEKMLRKCFLTFSQPYL